MTLLMKVYFSFDRTDLNNCIDELCSNEEEESLTRIIRGQ